jgi:hypothetical protein
MPSLANSAAFSLCGRAFDEFVYPARPSNL